MCGAAKPASDPIDAIERECIRSWLLTSKDCDQIDPAARPECQKRCALGGEQGYLMGKKKAEFACIRGGVSGMPAVCNILAPTSNGIPAARKSADTKTCTAECKKQLPEAKKQEASGKARRESLECRKKCADEAEAQCRSTSLGCGAGGGGLLVLCCAKCHSKADAMMPRCEYAPGEIPFGQN